MLFFLFCVCNRQCVVRLTKDKLILLAKKASTDADLPLMLYDFSFPWPVSTQSKTMDCPRCCTSPSLSYVCHLIRLNRKAQGSHYPSIV